MIEIMHDGRPCPDYIQRMLNTPLALRARAEIRRQVADQDRQWGDTLAEWRNRAVAQDLDRRAAQGG